MQNAANYPNKTDAPGARHSLDRIAGEALDITDADVAPVDFDATHASRLPEQARMSVPNFYEKLRTAAASLPPASPRDSR